MFYCYCRFARHGLVLSNICQKGNFTFISSGRLYSPSDLGARKYAHHRLSLLPPSTQVQLYSDTVNTSLAATQRSPTSRLSAPVLRPYSGGEDTNETQSLIIISASTSSPLCLVSDETLSVADRSRRWCVYRLALCFYINTLEWGGREVLAPTSRRLCAHFRYCDLPTCFTLLRPRRPRRRRRCPSCTFCIGLYAMRFRMSLLPRRLK